MTTKLHVNQRAHLQYAEALEALSILNTERAEDGYSPLIYRAVDPSGVTRLVDSAGHPWHVDALAAAMAQCVVVYAWDADAAEEVATNQRIPREIVSAIANAPAEHYSALPEKAWHGLDDTVEPVDLSTVSLDPEKAVWLRRSDKVPCIYPGRLNIVWGPSETGKTWFALNAMVEAANSGFGCAIFDLEDSAGAVSRRLMRLGLDPDEWDEEAQAYLYAPLSNVTYYGDGCMGAFLTDSGRERLLERLAGVEVIVLDATTEMLGAMGLDENKASDVASFYNRVPKWLAASTGAAVILIDHTAKTGTSILGSQHKKAGVDGVSIRVEEVEKFGPSGGHSRILIDKDKQASVRESAVGAHWADFWHDGMRYHLDPPGVAVAASSSSKRCDRVDELVENIRESVVSDFDGTYPSQTKMYELLKARGQTPKYGEFREVFNALKSGIDPRTGDLL